MSEREIQPYERDIINTYRGWKDIAEDPSDAIDCDFVRLDDDPTTFESIDEVSASLEKQLENLPADAPALLRDKLIASLMFIDVDSRGKEVDFSEFTRVTMGAEPKFFNVDPDDAEAQELDARLREFGMAWDKNYRIPYRKATIAFHDSNTGKQVFDSAMNHSLRRLNSYTPGRKIPSISLDLFSQNIPDKGATYAENGQIDVAFNVHNRHEWGKGEVEETTYHEGAHAVHLDVLSDAVAKGEMSPALGVTSMVTPEMTHFETLGLAAGWLSMALDINPASEFQAIYSPRAYKVRSNSGYMINNGFTEKEVAKYVRDRLPLDPIGDLYSSIRDRRDSAHVKAYHGAYTLGIEMVTPILALPAEKQDKIVRALFTTFLTAPEVADTIAKAAA
ncbi:MAG: hypothetical protein ACXWLH_03020 [Candidatus Saccharimonadales bacterium]